MYRLEFDIHGRIKGCRSTLNVLQTFQILDQKFGRLSEAGSDPTDGVETENLQD